ncbi:MAG: helix-turn-helix domain-containing protein [Spirochaetales bacterium]|nr:helix-turn-helix domain-containing protein [Spirochaetales bacterium]
MTRLSIKTLYSYAEKQIVPHVKLGKRLFFSEAKLESWVAGYSIDPDKERNPDEWKHPV